MKSRVIFAKPCALCYNLSANDKSAIEKVLGGVDIVTVSGDMLFERVGFLCSINGFSSHKTEGSEFRDGRLPVVFLNGISPARLDSILSDIKRAVPNCIRALSTKTNINMSFAQLINELYEENERFN